MIKQFGKIVICAISFLIYTSCQKIDESNDARLLFNIAHPVDVIATKGVSYIDTNSFILTITNVNGSEIYHGAYGARPKEIVVPAGTYDVSVVSEIMGEPAFEKPVYGDEKMIVVSNGQSAEIDFLCKMTNASISLSYTDRFLKRYGTDGVKLKQNETSITYSPTESRALYFEVGNVEFIADNEPLFNRVLKAGEFHTLQLDASNNESESNFSISIDTTITTINEKIIVGEDNSGANGLSAQTAMTISSAFEHVGDTLWVWGYIVGTSITSTKFNMTPPFDTDAHLALAEDENASSRADVCPVELSKNALKESLGLATNPNNLKRRIAVRGVIVDSYFGTKGIKSVSDYYLQE